MLKAEEAREIIMSLRKEEQIKKEKSRKNSVKKQQIKKLKKQAKENLSRQLLN